MKARIIDTGTLKIHVYPNVVLNTAPVGPAVDFVPQVGMITGLILVGDTVSPKP